ncbi:unnamed protein product [Camellia sinensis]
MFKKLFNSRKSKKGGCAVIEDIEEIVAQRGPKQFTFETLYSATEGFHEKNRLGRGGFANVYKGVLKNGRKIAVKKPLVISEKGKKDFMNEAKLLLECANHRNVVKFLGFCSHGEEIMLVFDFSINGNLDNLLFKTGRADELDWKRTYDIILGIARGLRYLHEEAHSVIIHFDIKPANILIDENWVPKIADFGTASLFPQDQMDVNISQVAGTPGYLAPECYVYGPLSVKADTYSFGVVVLELISNQKNWLSHARSSNGQVLRDKEKADALYKKGNVLEFVDPKLASSAVPDQVRLCLQIAVMCTQYDPQLRPTMGCVSLMLSENHSSSSTLLEPMRDGSSSSTAQNSGSIELANNGSSGPNIHLENEGLPEYRRITRSPLIRPEVVPFFRSSYPSSSCSSGNGIQIEFEQGPVGAAMQEQEEGIPIPIISKEDSREKTPLPPAYITKEPASFPEPIKKRKKVAEQLKPTSSLEPTKKRKKVAEQQTVESAAKKHPFTLTDIEEWAVKSSPKDRVGNWPLQIIEEFKVDIERPENSMLEKTKLAIDDDAEENFLQDSTKLISIRKQNTQCLEASFKSLDDEGNKSSWCEGFIEEGGEGKAKAQLTSLQDVNFMARREVISRKVGVAEDSPLFPQVPLSSLVEQQQPPTAEVAVDDSDHGGGGVADSNG